MIEICLKRIMQSLNFPMVSILQNLSNPSILQINSQLVARGAGGRGEALGYVQNIYFYIEKWSRIDFQYFQDNSSVIPGQFPYNI